MRENILVTLALTFVPFSLAAVGGGHSVLAGIQHAVVVDHAWLSSEAFVEVFAAARIAPDPGSMLVTLVGWKLAGWSGAVVATLAFFVPSSILCLAAAHGMSRYRERRWMMVLEDALRPIGTGLVLAGVVAILGMGVSGPPEWVLAVTVAAVSYLRPSIHPVLLLTVSAIVLLTIR